MLLDPFFGVFDRGVRLAKWLNRILLVVELCVFAVLATDLYYKWHCHNWLWLLAPFALTAFVTVINTAVRWMWNIVMVIVFGTTDADEIADAHDRKIRRREARESARLEARRDREERALIIESMARPEYRDVEQSRVDYGNYAASRDVTTLRVGDKI